MLLHEKEWSMHERRVMREYKNTNKKKKDADKRLTESVGGQCLWCKGRKCQRERCLSCMESLPSISEACMSCTTNKSLYWRAGGIEREREREQNEGLLRATRHTQDIRTHHGPRWWNRDATKRTLKSLHLYIDRRKKEIEIEEGSYILFLSLSLSLPSSSLLNYCSSSFSLSTTSNKRLMGS